MIWKLDKSKKTKNIKEYYIELIKVLLEHINSNIDIYSAVVKINSNSIARDMMTDAIIISAAKEIDSNFENICSIPTNTIVLYYASAIINIIIDNLYNNKQFDTKELIHIITELTPDLDCFKPIK